MEKIFKTLINLVLIVLGIRLLQELLRKKKCPPCPDPNITVDRGVLKYIPDQLVVWKKPGVSDADFNKWKAGKLQQYSGLLIKKMCACDDSLELWEGDNVTTFISEGVASAGGKGPTITPNGGGDAVACYSYNLIIDLPEPLGCLPERYGNDEQRQFDISGTVLTVAVFDTGLREDLKAMYTDAVPSCLPGGEMGWNFTDKNKATTTDDDYPSHHGSAVTKFIIDQELQYRKQKINILPVKIHNSEGKSDLFSILCGFAYAANCGAKIINASFGFYALKGSEAPAILSQFVRKHLTNRNILLIAAAGNVNADSTVGGPISTDVRNLEHHPFFPACLSKTHENVLAVTTVSVGKMQVSPSQNFSNLVIDAGVDCDQVIPNDFRFQSPLNPLEFILGSSYATPIITGKIAQHYTALMSAMPGSKIRKIALLQEMEKLGIIQSEPGLVIYIRDGYWTKK